jgi:transposase
MASKDVAVKYAVSRAWVDRVKQRRREAGELTPRVQTRFRRRALDAAQEHRLGVLITVRPDATLAELRAELPTTAALSTLWRAIDRLGLTVKKNGVRGRTAAS